MRAREFTINVPINIKINGDGDPEIDVDGVSPDDQDDKELDQNPVMMNPQQQEIELKKSEQGKKTPYLDDLLANNDIGNEEEAKNPPEVGNPEKNINR